jgi:hypothetical protein
MKLPLFPLHTVLFPGMLLPLHIFEPRYRKMINECLDGNRPFGVALIAQGPEVGGRAEPHAVGTWALISRVERQPDGRMSIEAVGQERFRILRLHDDEDYLTGTVERFPLGGAKEDRAQQLARRLRPWLERYLTLLGQAVDSPFANPARRKAGPAGDAHRRPNAGARARDLPARIEPAARHAGKPAGQRRRRFFGELTSASLPRFPRMLNNRPHRSTMRATPVTQRPVCESW